MADDVEDYTSEEAKKWAPTHENYRLEKLDDMLTRFSIESDIEEEYYEYFQGMWTSALEKLKQVCEENLAPFESITIETVVDAPLEGVWTYWTAPEHMVKWNFASEDWHCPKASNDLRAGGRFVSTMAALDGSMAFDFAGTYTEVVPMERIVNQLDDGRMMWVSFEALGSNQTRVVETFEAEDENTLELQRDGWQAILDNFKLAAEGDI